MIQIFIHPDKSVAMVEGPDVKLIFENYYRTVKIKFKNESTLNIDGRLLKIVNYDKNIIPSKHVYLVLLSHGFRQL